MTIDRNLDDEMDRDPTSDELTPPRPRSLSGLRPPTDSERQQFVKKWASGVPVVRTDEDEDTSPIDVLDRSPDPDDELKRRMRIATSDPGRLADLLAKLYSGLLERQRSERRQVKSERSANEAALAELRQLLSQPPNGATAELQREVAALKEEVAAPKKWAWKAAGFVIATVLGSATAIVASFQASAERKGRQDEQIHQLQQSDERTERTLERLERGPQYNTSPRWPVPPMPTQKDPQP